MRAYTLPASPPAPVPPAAFWNEQVRDNLNEVAPFFADWQSYTPTFSNTWANGNASTYGRYLQVGKMVIVKGWINIGSTTTKGASLMTISLPVASVNAGLGADEQAPEFSGRAVDTAVSAYDLSFERPSTTTIGVKVKGAAGTYVAAFASVTSTIPFTWGTGDSVQFAGVYEAA
jgi:hypothetical protein